MEAFRDHVILNRMVVVYDAATLCTDAAKQDRSSRDETQVFPADRPET